MDDNPGQAENEKSFCWEQIVKTNRMFRISHVFAPRTNMPKLLPLYALFSSVEQICTGVSDEDLARSRLSWWRTECLDKSMDESNHPVLRELVRSGAAQDLRKDSIAQLIEQAGARLNAGPLDDMEDLKRTCRELHRPQLELELSLSGLDEVLGFDPELTAHSGLLQLIRESAGLAGQGRYWWLPLNLLARHGISRDEVANHSNSEPGGKLLAEILKTGSVWGRGPDNLPAGGVGKLSQARHYFVITDLYARKLRQLERSSPDSYPAVLNGFRLADLFAAWGSARRIARILRQYPG